MERMSAAMEIDGPAGPGAEGVRRQAPRNVASILDSARELGIRDAQGLHPPTVASVWLGTWYGTTRRSTAPT